jgi:flagellar biosynthetic protein FlhB
LARGVSRDLTTTIGGLLANSWQISVDGPALPHLFRMRGGELLSVVALPFIVLVLALIGGNMIQHRLVWSAEGLKPGLSKISPLVGLKRLFSSQSLAKLGKGVAKLIIIGAVLTMLMWPSARAWRRWSRSIWRRSWRSPARWR